MTKSAPLLLALLIGPLLTGETTAANMPVTMVKAARARVDSLAVAQAKSGLEATAQRTRLEEISRQEAALTADLTARRDELAKLLGALALYRRQPPPALLVSPETARDAVRGAILARALTPDLTRRAQALSAQLAQVAVLRRQAAAANEALFNAQSEQAERGAAIAQAVQDLPPAAADARSGGVAVPAAMPATAVPWRSFSSCSAALAVSRADRRFRCASAGGRGL